MQIALDQAIPRTPFFTERMQAILMAVAVHALVLGGGSWGLMNKVEYGMDASAGLAEVDLIAAPAEPVQRVVPPSVPITPEDIVEPTDKPVAPVAAVPAPATGNDTRTIHRAGSSEALFQPGYYRNLPPRYPEQARALKQQGRVLLEVLVTAEGKVGSSRIKESSGFPLLDEAALKGIQTWKFRPASMGGLRVDILADIPIRFKLK